MIKFLLRAANLLKVIARKICNHESQYLFNGETPVCPSCGSVGREIKDNAGIKT